jgi:hypothetical protein
MGWREPDSSNGQAWAPRPNPPSMDPPPPPPRTEGSGRQVVSQWPRLQVMANCRHTKELALPVSRLRKGPTGMPASQKPLSGAGRQLSAEVAAGR